MSAKKIDTLQWTRAERLNKTLFVKLIQNPSTEAYSPDKSFADVLAIAKRCYDVRLVWISTAGEVEVMYLGGIVYPLNSGPELKFFSYTGNTYTWNEQTFEQVEQDPEAAPNYNIANP